jgi:hypothetical protein
MFVQHLVEKTNEIIKAEKRTRRNVQYGDVGESLLSCPAIKNHFDMTIANAVARLDHLEFLSDVVPRTTTYAKVQERRRRKEEAEAAKVVTQSHASSSQNPDLSNPTQEAAAVAPEPFTNGSPYPPQTFAGPSTGRHSINLLEEPEAMDVDPPMPMQYQPQSISMPSTASMLEKARAASERAGSGPSPSSSAPFQPPPSAGAGT